MATLSFQGQGFLKISSSAETVSALAAGAEETLDITDSDAAVGDLVLVNPSNAGAESSLGIVAAWVSAAGTIKVRITNVHAADALTGGSRTFYYAILRA
jgi:hypothetical protein